MARNISAERKTQFQAKIDYLDHALREAKVQEVRSQLAKLRLSDVPTDLRLSLADIARRAGLPNLIIRLLRPVVRPAELAATPATEAEVALYAAGLTRIGAFREAGELFKQLTYASREVRPASQTWFYAGQFEMIQWDYRAAIPHFQKFIQTCEIQSYQLLIGYLNLAACLIAEARLDEAEACLERILTRLGADSPSLLKGNVAELAAQIAIQRADYKTAHLHLLDAHALTRGGRETYQIFVDKWNVLIPLLEGGPGATESANVLAFQARALEAREFEAARDCDLYLAKATSDFQALSRLYFGTRFKAYRQRLPSDFLAEVRAVDSICMTWGSREPCLQFEGDRIDSLNQTLVVGRKQIHLTKLESRLLTILTSDRYRPLQMGEVISELYPDEYLHPITTVQKGFQIIDRLRRRFAAESFPLSIEVSKGQVQLRGKKAPVSYRVWAEDAAPARVENVLASFRAAFEDRPFGSGDIAEHLNVGQRQARRVIREAVASGSLAQTKAGRGARYRFKKSA